MSALRRQTRELLDFGRSHGRIGTLINGSLILLILANVAAVVLDSVEPLHRLYRAEFHAFELASVAVFAVEYLLRLWSCVDHPSARYRNPAIGRLRYAVTPMAVIDLLAIAPTLLQIFLGLDLRLLRLLRLLRVLKLTRYSASLDLLVAVFKEEARAFGAVLAILAVTLVLVAGVMQVVEHEAQPQAFGSIPDAMWWTIVTLTTLGYGDVVPHTTLGKVIGGFVAVIGVGILALLAGLLSSGFNDQIRIRRGAYQRQVNAALFDGRITAKERAQLDRNRDSLGLTEADAELILDEVIAERHAGAPACPHCGKPLHALPTAPPPARR
jgi:voltage-gated potassium channel